MSNQLTAEQKRKIEENRRKALERRAQRLGQIASSNNQTSGSFNSTHEPPKANLNTLIRVTSNSGSAPKPLGLPFKQDSPGHKPNVSQSNSSREV